MKGKQRAHVRVSLHVHECWTYIAKLLAGLGKMSPSQLDRISRIHHIFLLNIEIYISFIGIHKLLLSVTRGYGDHPPHERQY